METDLRLQDKYLDIPSHFTRVNPPPTPQTSQAPPEEGEGGVIAVHLPTSPGKIIPEHQTVSRTVQDVDIGPGKVNGSPITESPQR